MPAAMTAEDYKAKVQRSLDEVWNKSNWEVAKETYADDVVVHSPSHPQPLQGREQGLRELHTALHIAHPDIHFQVHKMVCEGKEVAVRWTVSGTNTGVNFGMSRAWPLCAAATHRSRTRCVASVMSFAYPAIRWRWNTGCMIRRWRSQKEPPLVRSPSPETRLNLLSTIGILG